MQRWMFIAVVLLIFFISCKEDKVIKPESILSQPAMIELLMDMHIADAHINLATTPQDSARQLLTGAYQKIFDKHQVTQETFNMSYEWYVTHADELDAIYEKVVIRLQEKKDSLK